MQTIRVFGRGLNLDLVVGFEYIVDWNIIS